MIAAKEDGVQTYEVRSKWRKLLRPARKLWVRAKTWHHHRPAKQYHITDHNPIQYYYHTIPYHPHTKPYHSRLPWWDIRIHQDRKGLMVKHKRGARRLGQALPGRQSTNSSCTKNQRNKTSHERRLHPHIGNNLSFLCCVQYLSTRIAIDTLLIVLGQSRDTLLMIGGLGKEHKAPISTQFVMIGVLLEIWCAVLWWHPVSMCGTIVWFGLNLCHPLLGRDPRLSVLCSTDWLGRLCLGITLSPHSPHGETKEKSLL